MTSILHLDSSPRGERSKSRQLTKEFITKWRALHPEDVITYRDLRDSPIPPVTEEWIAADFTPKEDSCQRGFNEASSKIQELVVNW